MAGRRLGWTDVVRAPAPVWWVTAAFVLLLATATVLYPPYRGPDEPKHVDLVLALDQGVNPVWSPESRQLSAGVEAGELLPNSRLGAPQRLADRDLPPRAERPSYVDEGGATPLDAPNQLVQHPPLYYLLLAGVLQLVPDWPDRPFDLVVGVLRLAGVLLLAPLPLLAHATARRLVGPDAPPSVPLLAAVLVTGVPQLVHIGAAVNNDNLQNLLAGVCVLVLAHVATGDLSRRTAVVAGLALGLGLLTKGLLLVFVPLLLLAYVAGWRRTRSPLRGALVSAVVAGAVAAVVGGWWWVRNLVEFGRVQPSGQARSTEVVRGWGPEAWNWLGEFGFFVNLRYWFDHPSGSSTGITVGLSFLATAVVLVLVLLALTRRAPSRSRTALGLAALPFPLLLAVLMSGSWESFTFGRDQPALQGRYMFGALVGLCAVTAVGVGRWLRGAHPAAGLAPALGWCLAVQVIAAGTAVRLYWWPADGGLPALLHGFTRVMPWPGPAVLVVMAATVVVTGVAAASVLRSTRGAGPIEEAVAA